MKRLFLILFIVQNCLTFIHGQECWSISIANSPRIEHRDPGIKNLLYYPISPSISTDYKITDRFSLSIGIFSHFEKDRDEAIGIPNVYFIIKTSLFEVPLQINYHLIDSIKKFDPFIKTAIRYTFYNLTVTMHDRENITKYNSDDSYLLWDFGAGFNFKIKHNFFILCQVSYGIGLKHEYEDFKYFEPLIGLAYKFN